MMKRAFRTRLMASIAGGIVAVAQANASFAQGTPPPAASDPASLGEIVVTAQFRSQNLQDTPLAISAVTGAIAEAKSQYTVNDIAKSAPSVNIEPSGNGGGPSSTIFIRGIGQSDSIPAVDPGVGVYIDDVYYGLLTGSNFDLLDIDRVEILRGPQGTLSGKNSLGGSMKIFTRQPSADLGGFAEVSYGSFDRMEAKGAINVPIIADKVMLRVSGIFRHRDGFFKRLDFGCVNPGTLPLTVSNSVNKNCKIGEEGGQELAAVRAALRVNLSDTIHNTLTYDKISDKQDTTPAKLLVQSPLWAGGLNFITPDKSYASYGTYIGHPFTAGQYQGSTTNENHQWGLSNSFEAEITDNLSLKSITAYRKTNTVGNQDGDASPYNVFMQEFAFDNKQFTQELRLSGQVSEFLDWTIGGFYYHSKLISYSHIDIPAGFVVGGGGLDLEFITADPIKAESKSGFAHGVFHLADNLNITAGLRYTDESKDYVFVRLAPDGGTANPLVAPLNGVVSSYSGNRWDYRVAIDYRWSDNLMTYAQVATGFKGGGVNPRPFFATQAAPFQPETVTSFEAGFKADFLDRRARLNVSAFYTDYSDMQIVVTSCNDLSPFPGAPCTATRNAGNSKLWGLEYEVGFQPVDGLTIDLAGSFIDFKYKNVDPATGIALNAKNPFLSKTKVSAGIQYEAAAFGGTLTPRLDYDYRSGFETEALKVSTSDLPGTVAGRGLFNARLTYRTADKDWELSAAVTNLADKFYYATKFDRAGAPYFTALGIPGRPREWSLSLKRNF